MRLLNLELLIGNRNEDSEVKVKLNWLKADLTKLKSEFKEKLKSQEKKI